MNAALIKVSLQHGNWFILPAQWYEAAKPKGKRAVSISGLSYTQTPSLGPQGTRMPEHSPQRVFRTGTPCRAGHTSESNPLTIQKRPAT